MIYSHVLGPAWNLPGATLLILSCHKMPRFDQLCNTSLQPRSVQKCFIQGVHQPGNGFWWFLCEAFGIITVQSSWSAFFWSKQTSTNHSTSLPFGRRNLHLWCTNEMLHFQKLALLPSSAACSPPLSPQHLQLHSSWSHFPVIETQTIGPSDTWMFLHL